MTRQEELPTRVSRFLDGRVYCVGDTQLEERIGSGHSVICSVCDKRDLLGARILEAGGELIWWQKVTEWPIEQGGGEE